MVSRLREFDLENKTVFLRADLNVTLINGKIFNNFKIDSIIPTIDLLLKKNGKIVLATHISRPKQKNSFYSTNIIAQYLKSHGYNIIFEKSLDNKIISDLIKTYQIVILENLRFYKEEKAQDLEFANKLKLLAEFYVNDAFGTLHRKDTSITTLPSLYSNSHKTIGLLIEKELKNLSKLKNDPQRPFTVIMGGGKVKDKLIFIEYIIPKIDNLILCPALVFTILKSKNLEIGSSLIEPNLLEYSKNILELASKNKINILIPKDYLVIENNGSEKLIYKKIEKFCPNDFGVSIGPESITYFEKIILNSKSIFFNCAMGFWEKPETLNGLKNLLELVSKSKAYKVLGGGDSVGAAQYFGLEDKIDFCSTGGGSTLAYLADQKLPGLEYL